jgi:starch phosphorylase
LYPFNDPGQLPVTPVRQKNGEWLRIPLAFPGFRCYARVWQAQVGRNTLYLLDTNDPANLPSHRGITAELYGGDENVRLKQEIVLGIGGWRLLRALDLHPEVCHLNEGHAAFLALERARSWMEDNHKPFDLALTVTRAGNLFTTHTPVAAGFDRFAPDQIDRYLGRYADEFLHIKLEQLLSLGRSNPNDSSELFNMAYLAIRGSGAVNGVSRLHGEVSRGIFQGLFPRWPRPEVPVSYVTNGVHTPSWDSAEADRLWTTVCGKDRWSGTLENLEKNVRRIADPDLWQLRTDSRRYLIDEIRKRLARQLAGEGVSQPELERAHQVFDPNTLTLGFARRFATYKRPNLLLHDPNRLIRILTNVDRPVQIVVAGKAHPADLAGQAMIQQWINFIRHSGVRAHAVFLPDYDMLLTGYLVSGVDLWINTPRRPWEACGTSGMKVLVNGGLNCSELDGWWAEAYTPEVGWAIGDGQEHGDDPAWDAAEADALYSLLEREIVPAFYNRDARGIPVAWTARMRESMAHLTPAFSSNRTLREYTEKHYLPAAAAYRQRSADQGKVGSDLIAWRERIERHWQGVRFGSVTVDTTAAGHHFAVQVYLDDLGPESVAVELYADPSVRQPLQRTSPLIGAVNGYVYSATVPANRPPGDYTPRAVPYKPEAQVPLEAHQILWQR